MQRSKITAENQSIIQNVEVMQSGCTMFQSGFEHKLDQYMNEVIPKYTTQNQAFVSLVQKQEIPEKNIQTQLEKLHEKVKKTQKDHMAALSALTRFYENCVVNLPKVKVQSTDELDEQMARLEQQRQKMKKAPPPKPPVFIAQPPQNQAIALCDYPGGYHTEKELLFKINDVIVLTHTEDEASGWFQGHLKSQPETVGWFPASYCQRLS